MRAPLLVSGLYTVPILGVLFVAVIYGKWFAP